MFNFQSYLDSNGCDYLFQKPDSKKQDSTTVHKCRFVHNQETHLEAAEIYYMYLCKKKLFYKTKIVKKFIPYFHNKENQTMRKKLDNQIKKLDLGKNVKAENTELYNFGSTFSIKNISEKIGKCIDYEVPIYTNNKTYYVDLVTKSDDDTVYLIEMKSSRRVPDSFTACIFQINEYYDLIGIKDYKKAIIIFENTKPFRNYFNAKKEDNSLIRLLEKLNITVIVINSQEQTIQDRLKNRIHTNYKFKEIIEYRQR